MNEKYFSGRYPQKTVNIIGCGYSGMECALFLAGHGVKVNIFDGTKNNNLRCKSCQENSTENEKQQIWNEVLKSELNFMGSFFIRQEKQLEKEGFKGCIPGEIYNIAKEAVKNNKNIQYFQAEIKELNPKEVNIIATGPKTSDDLYKLLYNKLGGMKCFKNKYISPVLSNIDENELYQSEEKNLFYLPLSYEEYIIFVNHIIDNINTQIYESEVDYIDGTIENLVCKHKDALKNYAMMPVYIDKLREKPYAVIKLYKEKDKFILQSLSSMLDEDKQENIFQGLKGFENAKLERKGSVEEAVYVIPKYVINQFNQSQTDSNIFFTGGILGVSGYLNCISTGFYTAMQVYKYLLEKPFIKMPKESCIGWQAQKIFFSNMKKMNDILDDYDIIKNENNDSNTKLITNVLNKSIDSLTKFKEEYCNGKYV